MKAKRSIRRGASGSGAAAPAAKGAAKTKRKFAMPRRIPLTKSTLAFGSGVIIFSVGFVLQNFGTHPASSLQDAKRPDVQTAELPNTLVESADLSAITPTSAGVLPVDRPLPPLPRDSVAVPATETEPGRGVTALAALQDTAVPEPLDPAALEIAPGGAALNTPVLPCEVTMTADPAPAAMVDLIVEAACLSDARFTLHHSGMMFHALTDENGRSSLRVPALAENAVFIASFDNSQGAVAQIEVPTLEFDATYFGEGHVYSASPGDMSAAASGSSGFLPRFGENAGADALMAEVYTFPTLTSDSAGRIGLSVEAEVTAANCGRQIAAQTLQLKPGETLRSRDVTLDMPACDANGDFLVLKNLFEDLKVAAN